MSELTPEEKREVRAKMARVWLGWILSFLVIELYAIKIGEGTLSTFVRRFFRVSDKEPLKFSVRAYWLWIICIVLTIHFAIK